MVRRTPLDITAAILEIAMQPTSISHIVARAYLNHQRGKRYINKLLQLGLLKRHNTKYITTEKGEELLLYYQRIKTLLKEPQEMIG